MYKLNFKPFHLLNGMSDLFYSRFTGIFTFEDALDAKVWVVPYRCRKPREIPLTRLFICDPRAFIVESFWTTHFDSLIDVQRFIDSSNRHWFYNLAQVPWQVDFFDCEHDESLYY